MPVLFSPATLGEISGEENPGSQGLRSQRIKSRIEEAE